MLISDWSSDVCSSCLDLALETKLDVQVRDWLSFAVQKLEELSILRLGLADGRYVISDELAANADSITSRRTSSLTNDRQVRARVSAVTADWARRAVPFGERIKLQRSNLDRKRVV